MPNGTSDQDPDVFPSLVLFQCPTFESKVQFLACTHNQCKPTTSSLIPKTSSCRFNPKVLHLDLCSALLSVCIGSWHQKASEGWICGRRGREGNFCTSTDSFYVCACQHNGGLARS